ncbi:MAG: flap endonuclease, partial [Anaerolineaceae bacterium]|nr:flap endonuclease [Anaerolineaceae bacterium]
GAKSSAAVLARYTHLEGIPEDPQEWGMSASRAARLAESLAQHKQDALLFRKLATLREDVPLPEKLADLEYRGAFERFKEICSKLGDEKIPQRVSHWR